MSKETDALIRYMKDSGIPHRVTSINTGKHAPHSYHYRNLAVDFAGPTPSRDSPALMAIFNAYMAVGDSLAELIYAQAPFNIKNGKRVPRYAESIHHDHVHVAVNTGWTKPFGHLPVVEIKPAENVKIVDRRVDWDVADYLDCPTGGVWLLFRDGGIGSLAGAPSKPENIPIGKDYWGNRMGARIKLNPDCPVGYIVVATTGEEYKYCF